MLFFHNYQALKYGRVDGLAAYTFIGAVESLGSLLMIGLALVQPLVAYLYGGGVTAGRTLSATWAIIPLSIGNCADVRIGCRTRRFSRLVQFARQCERFLPHTDWLSVRRRSCCWAIRGRLLLSGDRQNDGFFTVDLR